LSQILKHFQLLHSMSAVMPKFTSSDVWGKEHTITKVTSQ